MDSQRFFLVLGGFAGFSVAFFAGLVQGTDITLVLRNASIGCLAGAIMVRGFGQIWIEAARDVEAQRRRARQLEAEQEEVEEPAVSHSHPSAVGRHP